MGSAQGHSVPAPPWAAPLPPPPPLPADAHLQRQPLVQQLVRSAECGLEPAKVHWVAAAATASAAPRGGPTTSGCVRGTRQALGGGGRTHAAGMLSLMHLWGPGMAGVQGLLEHAAHHTRVQLSPQTPKVIPSAPNPPHTPLHPQCPQPHDRGIMLSVFIPRPHPCAPRCRRPTPSHGPRCRPRPRPRPLPPRPRPRPPAGQS